MAEFRLRIKAASGQTGVTVSNSGLAGHTLDVNALEHVYVGGIALASAATNYYAIRGNYATGAEVDSCAVAMSNGGRGFHTLHRGYVHDTAFTDGAGAGREFVLECFASLYRRCAFVGATQYGVQANNYGGGRFEACAFSGCQKAIRLGGSRAVGREETVVRNCTFYDCTKAIVDEAGAGDEALVASVKNCIFSTTTAGDFAIYAQGLLARVESDYNCFHGYTSPCHVDGMDKSLAEWQSETDWQGNSPDAHSFEADPLLTDPGSGDFSLGSASPCRGAGMGAGVTHYRDGTAADPHHPNIGSEGTASDPPAPSWAADTSNVEATDQGEGDGVSVAWDAASIGGSGLSVEYAVESRVGEGAYTRHWIGAGTSCSVDELTTDEEREFRVGARAADYEQDWQYPSDTDSATPTWTALAAAPGLTVSATGLSVTATLTGTGGVTYRARLESRTAQEDERQRSGPGDVALTATTYGKHRVHAWAVGTGNARSEPSLAREVFLHETTSEWSKAAAAIAAHVGDAAGEVTVVVPRQRFDPAKATEFIEVGKPSFEGGAGRSGERRTGVTVQVWCVAKVGGATRNLARGEELADIVEDALTDASIEIESGAWLTFGKVEVTGEGMDEADMRQVVRVTARGFYERS